MLLPNTPFLEKLICLNSNWFSFSLWLGDVEARQGQFRQAVWINDASSSQAKTMRSQSSISLSPLLSCVLSLSLHKVQTLALWLHNSGYNFCLNRQIHTSDPLWIHFFCNAIVAADSPLGDLRKRFLIRVYSSQRLPLYAFNGYRAFHSSLEQCAASRHRRVPNWHLRRREIIPSHFRFLAEASRASSQSSMAEPPCSSSLRAFWSV